MVQPNRAPRDARSGELLVTLLGRAPAAHPLMDDALYSSTPSTNVDSSQGGVAVRSVFEEDTRI
jgi:hypothetical protein